MDQPLLLTLQLMLHICLFTSQENRKTHPPKGIEIVQISWVMAITHFSCIHGKEW